MDGCPPRPALSLPCLAAPDARACSVHPSPRTPTPHAANQPLRHELVHREMGVPTVVRFMPLRNPMSGDSLLFLQAGFFALFFGVVFVTFASTIASFYRDKLSRILPKRYWFFWADAGRVRFSGVAGTTVAVLLISWTVVQLVVTTS